MQTPNRWFVDGPRGVMRKSVLSKALLTSLAVLATLFAGHRAVAQSLGSIQGTVIDISGAPILGAVVTIQGSNGISQVTVSDGQGAFQISSLPLSDYNVKISASGMDGWNATKVPASIASEAKPLLVILHVAPAVTSVTVGLPQEEVAQEQLKQETQQRVLAVLPNYYVAYAEHPAPLTPKQKLHLGFKVLSDPATIAAVGITAGIQQEKNSYYQYGQGTQGFAKRFGAEYATAADAVLITSVLANSVLHQDPRYFYSGKGNTAERAWYAVKSAFRAKGDNGSWQPPYSGLIGAIAAAEIAETYHPGSRTQYTLIGRAVMFRFAGLIGLNLAEELFLKKLTTHAHADPSAANAPVLHEGTPVTLIAVDGFSPQGARNGQTVTFVVAEDVRQAGMVLARAGDAASGMVSHAGREESPGVRSIALERVTLRAGNVNVPLRSNAVRGAAAAVQFRVLAASSKVEVTLFVAEDVEFPAGR